MTSDNQSTAKPDSAVSPTISAGEAPMSFRDWYQNKIGTYDSSDTFYGANEAWIARDAEVTALKQELAQMREKIKYLKKGEL